MVGPGAGCEGARLVPIAINGTAGFGNYRLTKPGLWEPFALQVIEVQSGAYLGEDDIVRLDDVYNRSSSD